ncbi:MAG TPA: oxaloacetate decarboxylase, partial [Marinobacter sp.]|nr:oxaloacetate decarboxylase [Marinobacter sp.]
EYGSAPAPFNKELQERVLDGKEAITCRPADKIEPEMDKLTAELKDIAKEKGIKLAEQEVDDVLTYALFPQIGLKFLENRGNPDAFEPVPSADDVAPAKKAAGPETYTVEVNGQKYVVAVNEGGEISQIEGQGGASSAP